MQNSNRKSAYIMSEWIRVYFTNAHTLQVKEHKPPIFFLKSLYSLHYPKVVNLGETKRDLQNFTSVMKPVMLCI